MPYVYDSTFEARRTVTFKQGRVPCVLDTTHDWRSPEEQAIHYITEHGCSDTPLSNDLEHIQDSGTSGEEPWEPRLRKACPICDRHGVVALFRNEKTAQENKPGDSLESHLGDDHHGGS